jgi:hypothetical protein
MRRCAEGPLGGWRFTGKAISDSGKKKPPRQGGGFESEGLEGLNTDYGAYVMVRTPATLLIVTVMPCVKDVG